MRNKRMAGQLIPPPELSPAPLPDHLTCDQRIALWVDLMNACDAMLRANLQRQVGPGGDIGPLYRQWYEQTMEEHDRMMEHLGHELTWRQARHAG
jgi:hypothetical protein